MLTLARPPRPCDFKLLRRRRSAGQPQNKYALSPPPHLYVPPPVSPHTMRASYIDHLSLSLSPQKARREQQRALPARKEEIRGYCECCKARYRHGLTQHLTSAQHMAFYENVRGGGRHSSSFFYFPLLSFSFSPLTLYSCRTTLHFPT